MWDNKLAKRKPLSAMECFDNKLKFQIQTEKQKESSESTNKFCCFKIHMERKRIWKGKIKMVQSYEIKNMWLITVEIKVNFICIML